VAFAARVDLVEAVTLIEDLLLTRARPPCSPGDNSFDHLVGVC
jgi:hypothetical protein